VRNPTLPLGLSLLLLVSHLQSLQASAEQSHDQNQNVQDAKARAQPAATTATDTAKTLLPGQFILQEGTPVKLRLSRNVSSADAHEGDSVDFGSSRAKIRAGIEGAEVSLEIRDHGHGIPQEVLESFKTLGSGAGVGLAGIRERLREVDGKLDLSSSGDGTVLRVSLLATNTREPYRSFAAGLP
jgi:C4-dicarboxylate-specific signal transduction histidine kinase